MSFGEHDFTVDPPLTPRKAMRKKCLDCCAESANEVKFCPITDCTLWPYRMGRGVCQTLDGKIKTSDANKKAGDARANSLRNRKTPVQDGEVSSKNSERGQDTTQPEKILKPATRRRSNQRRSK